jgi:hypothetical protein
MTINGPKEMMKTAMTALANERKFLISNFPEGEMQKARRR